MKILKSSTISPFGGINYVFEEAIRLNINSLINKNLPTLPKQSRYNWFDLLMSYWSVFFCGGDCAEDLSINLKDGFLNNPYVKFPSPDRVLERFKSLADQTQNFKAKRGRREHQFSLATQLNRLNLKMLGLMPGFKRKDVVLDYDNTLLYAEKADTQPTYKKENGYCPGVGLIGQHVVYVENRNGSSSPHVLQHETIERMFSLLEEAGITVDAIRADSASFTYEILEAMAKSANRIFVRARMSHTIEKVVARIEAWEELKVNGKVLLRGSTVYTPFERAARDHGVNAADLKEYRIVVTKEARKDGQINMFTGEAYNYSAIVTSDFVMTDDDVVFFYNARGAAEREFDVLKNDFGWNNMPFSKLNQNAVFLLVMAMCKNLYVHIINLFSRKVKTLSPNHRLKKFIYRFICVPGKWIKTGGGSKLRVYGKIAFET